MKTLKIKNLIYCIVFTVAAGVFLSSDSVYGVYIEGSSKPLPDSTNTSHMLDITSYSEVEEIKEIKGEDLPQYVPGEVIIKLKKEDPKIYPVEGSLVREAEDGAMLLLKKKGLKSYLDRSYYERKTEDDVLLLRLKKNYDLREEKPVFKNIHARLASENLSQNELRERVISKFPKRQKRIPKEAKGVDLFSIYKLKIRKGQDVLDICSQLSQDPDIEYAEPNYIARTYYYTPNDELYPQQWAHQNTDAELGWDIDRGSPDIIIAIVDTGVDYDHEDLTANIWINQNELKIASGDYPVGLDADSSGEVDYQELFDYVGDINLDGSADFKDVLDSASPFMNEADDNSPPNGMDDDIIGWDYVDIDTQSFINMGYTLILLPEYEPEEDYTVIDNDPSDYHGHGTHCSGIASAVGDNGIGVAGVTHYSKIMPVRAGFAIIDPLDREGGILEDDDIANAITYAAYNGADVISMSFGDSMDSGVIRDAIDDAYDEMGVVLVAAAGNDSSDVLSYPAAYDNVMAVAATVQDDTKAGYSNYGSWIDVSAPGSSILSTVPLVGTMSDPSGYRSASGTSMACPYVAGLAGLILSNTPAFNKEEVRQIIRDTTDNIDFLNPGYEDLLGTGRVNVYQALLEAPNSDGRIYFDRACYPAPSDPLPLITVWDTDLNMDGGVIEAVTVEVSSSTETVPEQILLTERAPDGNIFEGSVSLEPGSVPIEDDGIVTVQHNDEIRAVYTEEVSPLVEKEATATVDLQPPDISLVQSFLEIPIGSTTGKAKITWETDEPATSILQFYQWIGGQWVPTTRRTKSEYVTDHEIVLTNWTTGITFNFAIEAEDIVGNSVSDPEEGNYNFYQFTIIHPGIGVVPPDLSFGVSEGSTTSVTQVFSISNTDVEGSVDLLFEIPELYPSWLSVSPLEGTIPYGSSQVDVQVTVDPTALRAGSYLNNITIYDNTVSGSPTSFPIQVTVSSAPVVNYRKYNIIDNGSGGSITVNEDGRFTPGEQVGLKIEVENFGSDNATGVSAILSLLDDPDSHMTIIDDTIDLDDIPAGTTLLSSEHFLIEAAAATPDNYRVTFALDIEDSDEHTWHREFPMAVISMLPSGRAVSDIRVDTDELGAAFSHYPQISSNNNGAVYAVWRDYRNGSADIYFNYSIDYGATWQLNDIRLDTDIPGAASSEYPQISSDDNGGVYAVWRDYRNDPSDTCCDIYFNSSTDFGATWQDNDIRLSTNTPGTAHSWPPQITSENNGRVYVVWRDDRNGNYSDVFFNYSTDYGATWQASDIRLDTDTPPGTASSFLPKISLGNNGYVYVMWQDKRNDPDPDDNDHIYDIYFNYSTDLGTTWQSSDIPINTGTLGTVHSFEPQMSSDNSGNIYVVWRERIDGYSSDIYFNYSTDYGATWQPSGIRLNTNAPAGTTQTLDYEISSDSNGYVYAVWLDGMNGTAVYFNYSQDYGATWQANPMRLNRGTSGTGYYLYSPKISSSDGGGVYVVWQDCLSPPADIYFNYSTDFGATWQDNDIRLDTDEPPGAATSSRPQISSDNNGRVYVAWRDERNGGPDGSPDIYFIPVDVELTPGPIVNYNEYNIIDNWSGRSFMVNGDGKLNPGERIELQIEVENVSPLDVTDVSATLSLTAPDLYITILDDTIDLGDIPDRTTVLSSNHFLIEADVDTPGGYMVTFALDIADSEEPQHSWHSEFQLAVIELIPASDIRLDTDMPGAKSSLYPRISSDDNGGVYAVWEDARGIHYNYSQDFGTTWQDNDIRLNSGTASSSRPQISSDNIGNIYVAWEDDHNEFPWEPEPHDIFFNRSTDYGATWLTSDIKVDTGPFYYDSTHQQISSDDNGNVYVVWAEGYLASPPGYPSYLDIYFNYSHDYGATWQSSDIRLNTDDPESNYSSYPKISLGDNGYVYVVWRDGRSGVRFNYSQDYGATWQSNDILVGGGGFEPSGQLQISSDDNGNVYVVWRGGSPYNHITFNRSTDHGATWEGATQLDSATTVYGGRSSPEISSDNNGNIYTVWQDKRDGEYDVYFNYSTDYGVTWLQNRLDLPLEERHDIRLDTDGLGAASSWYPQISSGDNGGVYVVWSDERNGSADIYFNYSTDYGVTWLQNRLDLPLEERHDIRLDKDTAGAASSESPHISSDDKRDIYVVWQDNRNGEYDIYSIPIYMYMDEELTTLNSIANQQVIEEEPLAFTVTATNLDGTQVELSLNTQGLSPDLQNNISTATFDVNFNEPTGETIGTFNWTPDPNTAGIYDPVVFVARDPSTGRYVSQAITIEVLERIVMEYREYSVIDDWSGGSFMVNGDGELNSGERVELQIKVENTGPFSFTATDVSATLSTADSYITILDDTVDFGDVPVGATPWSSNNFLIEANDATPDNHTVTFALNITDSDQRLWCEDFQITVTISSFDIRVNDASITASSVNPQISSDDNGNTYIVWQDYRNGNSDIYFNYSTDDGDTWQPNDTRLDTASADSRNPQISSDNVGRVYAVWEDYRNGNYDIYFNYSTDFGVTWQTSDIQIDTGTANSEKVQIRSDNSGHVYVMWQDPRNGYPDIYFNSSSNYGATWQGEERLDTDPAGEGWSYHAHMSNDNSGNVYVVWEDGRDNKFGHLYFNYSTDFGATWQLSDIDINGDGGLWLPRISCGTNGKVYVTCEGIDTSRDIYFNYSTDYGAAGTWQQNYIRVNTDQIAVGDAGNQQISSDNNGNIYVVWEDYRDGEYDIYFNYSHDYGAAGTWQASDIRLDRGTAGVASSLTPQISSDNNGGVYVAWQDYRDGNNDIYFNYSIDYGATWQFNDIRLDTDAAGTASSENPQISSNNSGGVYVAWQDNRDGEYDIYFIPIDISEGFITLDPISDQEVEGLLLEFEVTATNAAGTQVELFFDIQGLAPELQAKISNATLITTGFDPPTTTGTFSWSLPASSAGMYYPVVFVARDPSTGRCAYQSITITVNPVWVLNMTEMDWYQNVPTYDSTGAAVSQMILNYIREGAEEPLLNQDEIYEYAKGLQPYGPELNANQMDKVLGHFDPYDYLVSNYYDGYDSRPGGNPYQGYNYTIDTYNPLEMNEYMRDVCHWMAYTVTKGNWWNPNAELVARPNTPAAVPIYGTYDHWVAVKGCVTSENPVPNPRGDPWAGSDFTVYGFWMKDPLITGIGQNTYKTAAECESLYFQPLTTGDAYDGLLLQIAEPPARFSNERLEITGNTRIKKHTRDLANLEFVGVEVKTSDYEDSSLLMALSSSDRVSLERDTHPIIKKESWRDLVDSYLLTDSEAVAAFEGSKMGSPILVERTDEASDYYLVPFGKRARRRFLTSAVIILDADEGYFKEASWTDEPERFLKINKRRALWLVRRGIVRDLISELRSLPRRPLRRYYRQRRRIFRQYIRLIRYIRRAEANLIWQPNSYSTSPYQPYWKININGSIWYVTQEGKVIPLQIDR